MQIRFATDDDLPVLLALHNHAVKYLTAAWTETIDTLEDRKAWLDGRRLAGLPVVVATNDKGIVLGFGSFGPFRPREGYRFTAEHTIYVNPSAQRQGVGCALLRHLILLAREAGYHALVGGIDGENTASVALHEKCGFQISGQLPQVGTKFGRWLDLILVTLVLNTDDPARN